MPEGINSYALDLELNLAENVGPKLESVIGQISQIEQQMTVLSTLDGSIGTGAEEIKNQLGSALEHLAAVDKQLGAGVSGVNEQMAEALGSAEGITGTRSDASSHLLEDLDSLEEIKDLSEEWEGVMGDSLESVEGIEDHLEQFYKKKLPAINAGSKEFEGTSKSSSSIWEGMTDIAGDMWSEIKKGAMALFDLKGAFNQALKSEEEFHTANYRLYGSMNGLAVQTANLTTGYGLLRAEGIAAYKALANVKAPRDEIFKLSASVGQFNRVTGVSVQQTADFERRMRVLGWGAAGTSRMLEWMGNAMTSFGLSTQDIAALMGDTGDGAIDLASQMDAATYKVVKEQQAAYMGFVKMAGGSAEAAAKMTTGLMDAGEAGMTARAALGILPEEMEDQSKMMEAIVRRTYAKTIDIMGGHLNKQEAMSAGMTSSEYDSRRATLDATAKLYGTNANEMIKLAREMQKKKVESLSGMIAEQDTLENRTQAEQMKRAAATQRMWDDAKARMMTSFEKLFLKITPILMWLIDNVLTPLIDIVVAFIDTLTGSESAIDSWGTALSALASPFETIYNLFFGTKKEAAEAWSAIKGFTAGLIGLVVAAGLIYVAWKMFNSAISKTNTAKLMQIAFSILMIGGGIFLMAYGMALLAREGGAGIAVMIMMAIILAVVAAALFFLAGLGPIVIGVALAIAAVFIAMGLAAMMVAYAISIATDSIIKLNENIDLMTAVKLVALALAMYLAAGLMAGAGMIFILFAGPIAFALLMISAIIFTLGLQAPTLDRIGVALYNLGMGLGYIAKYTGPAVASLAKIKKSIDELLSINVKLALAGATIRAAVRSIMSEVSLIPIQFALVSVMIRAATRSIMSEVSLIPIQIQYSVLGVKITVDSIVAQIMRIPVALFAASTKLSAASQFASVQVQASSGEYGEMLVGIATMLDSYVVLVEDAADRAWRALMFKLRPAMEWARMAGIDQNVKAETISTIKVMNDDDYAKNLENRAKLKETQAQTKLMKELLKAVEGSGQTGVKKITEMLEMYLPQMVSEKSGLTPPNQTQWMR